MTAPDDDALIAAGIESGLAKPSPFLILPRHLESIPGARQQFQAAATAAGRRLGLEPHSPALDAARQAQAADTPVVSRHDRAAFLANVSKIAKGQVRCE